jgi:hypothetical protein
MGKHLRQVKNRVGHGQWLDWLNDNFPWSVDTAENYMGAAKVVAANPDMQFVNPTKLYVLAKASQKTFDEVAQDIRRGDIPTKKEVVVSVLHLKGETKQIPYYPGKSETLKLVPDEIAEDLERKEREEAKRLEAGEISEPSEEPEPIETEPDIISFPLAQVAKTDWAPAFVRFLDALEAMAGIEWPLAEEFATAVHANKTPSGLTPSLLRQIAATLASYASELERRTNEN